MAPRRLDRTDGETLGPLKFNSKTADFFREKIELPFFEYHLKGKGQRSESRGLGLSNRHRPMAGNCTAWPPSGRSPVALSSGRRPAGHQPATRKPTEALRRILSDPPPVPYLEKITIGMTPDYMVEDQRLPRGAPTCWSIRREGWRRT